MPARNTLPNPEPEWFNDINYDFIEGLDLRGWHIQLIERQIFKLDKIMKPDLTDCQLWERYLERIINLAENPNDAPRQRSILPALYEISPFHAFMDEDDEANEYDRNLYVNLNAPDKELKRQFAEWLSNVRKSAPIPGFKQGISRTNMKAWRKYKLLRLHDLLVFKDITGEIKSVEGMFDWLYKGVPVESQKDYMFDRIDNLDKVKQIIFAMSFQSVVGKI